MVDGVLVKGGDFTGVIGFVLMRADIGMPLISVDLKIGYSGQMVKHVDGGGAGRCSFHSYRRRGWTRRLACRAHIP